MARITTNQMTGAEAMVRILEAHGVKHIFGLCGDTAPLLRCALSPEHKIITSLHVMNGLHPMADGYSRVIIRLAYGPSGGGAAYILPGVVEANESSSAVLAITSDVATTSIGHYPLTELDQAALFQPLTKWNTIIPRSEMVPDMVRRAFRSMTTGRPGAAHLGFPIDVQRGLTDANGIWADAAHKHYPAYPTGPDWHSVEAAVSALLSAKNPIIICGGGVVIAGGEEALDQLATRLDIVVATTVSGQGSLPDVHPNCLGVIGSNGGVTATREAVDHDRFYWLPSRLGNNRALAIPQKRNPHSPHRLRPECVRRVIRYRTGARRRCPAHFRGYERSARHSR